MYDSDHSEKYDSDHSEKYALACLRMEADCKQLAAETTDPTLTAHFVRMSKVWAGLADSEPPDSEPKSDGKGGKVKSRKQAIAIALNEAGNSKNKSDSENRRSEAKTENKEARGRTAQQEKEGKTRLGATGKRESSRAMGGKNATHKTAAFTA